jgi:hypothetical protein
MVLGQNFVLSAKLDANFPHLNNVVDFTGCADTLQVSGNCILHYDIVYRDYSPLWK